MTHRELRSRGAWRSAGATVIVVLTLAMLGCDPGPVEDHYRGVLIIAVDALRADRVGSYGYERDITPTIDELAADPDAVLFRRHYVQGTATKTSTASLFTGLFAFQHGVVWGHEMQENPTDTGSYATQVLSDELETMAERFRSLGYYTFGVVKSHHQVPEYGFAQGFDDYFGPKELGGDTKRIRKVLELSRNTPGPFLGYLHLAGVHHPFRKKERNAEIMEQYGFSYDEAARAKQGVDFTTSKMKRRINEEGLKLEPDDVRFVNVLYDAKTRRMDQNYLRLLIDGLKRMERYDDMLIILTSDHGEELYDHKGWAHGHALWDEVIHVPFIVKFPKGQKPATLEKEVDTVTQSIDLIPSLLSFYDHPMPEDLPGTDIFLGEPRGSAFAETRNGWTLVEERYKLIVTEGSSFLSDHLGDPKEQVNLALQEGERLEGMRTAVAALRQWVAIRPQEAPVKETVPDEEAIEALKSLGYLQ
jgi:arylsulfatase A-like enzyme